MHAPSGRGPGAGGCGRSADQKIDICGQLALGAGGDPVAAL
jgi:hypothetical protein